MSNYNPFTSFIGGNNSNRPAPQQPQNRYNQRVNQPTEKMINLYYRMCEQKAQKAVDPLSFTFNEMQTEIDRLMKLPNPASPAQLEKIDTLIDEIRSLGKKISLKPERRAKLTGGQSGSASDLIERLVKMRQELNAVAPPSEQQLETMLQWFLCPDIPFETIGIEKRIYLTKLTYWSTEYNVPEELEVRPWRLLTPDEFVFQLKQKMTQQQANAFIDAHRKTFLDWKRTRITSNQMTHLKKLEQDMAVLTRKPDYAPMADGSIEIIDYGTSRERMSPVSYTPMDDIQLAQMSFEEASTFIEHLKDQLRDTELRSIGLAPDATQQMLQEKHTYYNPERGTGSLADNPLAARIREHHALQDVIYRLESVAGHRVDNLHELIKESLVENVDNADHDSTKSELKDFMQATINYKQSIPKVFKDIGRLFILCEDSTIATEIAEEINAEFSAHAAQFR